VRTPAETQPTKLHSSPTHSRDYHLPKRRETPHPKAPPEPKPKTQRSSQKSRHPRGGCHRALTRLHTLEGRRGRQYQWQQRTPERRRRRGRKQLEEGQSAPRNPRSRMREPQLPQQHYSTSGQGQTMGTDAPSGSPIDPTTTTIPHQQLTTTIYTILHIVPPDASDAIKIKKAFPQTEPDQRSTRTKLKAPISKQKSRMQDDFHKSRTQSSTKLATPSPTEAGNGSDMQQHAEQSLAHIGDRVSMSRNRHHSLVERLPGSHPHTISRLSELLSTCTDEQFVEIIRQLSVGWTATNDRGNTVKKDS